MTYKPKSKKRNNVHTPSFSHLGSLYLQPRKMFTTSNKQGFISAGATHLASIINKITNVPVSIIVTSLKIVEHFCG